MKQQDINELIHLAESTLDKTNSLPSDHINRQTIDRDIIRLKRFLDCLKSIPPSLVTPESGPSFMPEVHPGQIVRRLYRKYEEAKTSADEYGFNPEAFTDVIFYISVELDKGTSVSASNIYKHIYEILIVFKTQSLGMRFMGQYIGEKIVELETEPELLSTMSTIDKLIQKENHQQTEELPREKDLRRLIIMTKAMEGMTDGGGRNSLINMAFIYFVALFEGYLLDIAESAISQDERLLFSSRKAIDNLTALSMKSIDDVKRYIHQSEVSRLSEFSETVTFLQEKLNIKICGTKDQENIIREIRSRRHLLIHNRGIVNIKYLDETKANLEVDKPIPLNLEYLEDTAYALCEVVKFVDEQSIIKGYCKRERTKG